MILVLVAGLAMFLADVGQALYVEAMSRVEVGARRRKLVAGLYDGLSDVFLGLAVAAAGTSIFSVDPTGHFRFHPTIASIVAQAALIAGSVAGADVGDALARWRGGRPS